MIAPDGRVRSARAIGGHPVLVQTCLDAVKDWKYEPAGEETTQIVEFEFKRQAVAIRLVPRGSWSVILWSVRFRLGEWRK